MKAIHEIQRHIDIEISELNEIVTDLEIFIVENENPVVN